MPNNIYITKLWGDKLKTPQMNFKFESKYIFELSQIKSH